MVLSSLQRDNLKKHVYKSEGCSLVEDLFLRYFWDWLTARFPLWLAPNTITFIGFVVTMTTSLSVILQDLGCAGKVGGHCSVGEGRGGANRGMEIVRFRSACVTGKVWCGLG